MTDESGVIGFVEWLIARKLSVRTVKQYAAHYKLFEKELGEKQLTQNFLDRFVTKHPSNISRSFLKNLFDYYEFTDLEIPKVKGRSGQKKRRSIRPEERKKLRSWLYNRGTRFGLMFDLSYYCALRREEVISVVIDDFYLEDYAKDPSKPCRLQIHGKGKRERPVIVPPKVMKLLINWLQQKEKIPMQKKMFGIGKSKWHEIFKDAVTSLGLRNYTLHDLRRTRATYWLDNGVDIVRVSRRLGHSDVSTTQRYINIEEERELSNWEKEF